MTPHPTALKELAQVRRQMARLASVLPGGMEEAQERRQALESVPREGAYSLVVLLMVEVTKARVCKRMLERLRGV